MAPLDTDPAPRPCPSGYTRGYVSSIEELREREYPMLKGGVLSSAVTRSFADL